MRDIINEKLGNADIIIAEAKRAGLDIALACALVHQESSGKNIFGCDHGPTGDVPPYCLHNVTKGRVQKLRAGDYKHGMNGVGLTQLTWWEFVEQAEELGGAHLPANQCRVGFSLLKSYLDQYPFMEALGAYNAGPENRKTVLGTYAVELNNKYEAWKKQLGTSADYPTLHLAERDNTWVGDRDSDKWAKFEPNMTLKTNDKGWLYVHREVQPVRWSWPVADAPPKPSSAWYSERHPTRYFWRPDVESWARWLVDNYGVWCNTYYEHPEEWGFRPSQADPDWLVQHTSLDVWAKAGRGYAIDKVLGDTIHARIFNDPGLPNIDWIIWQGWMWTAAGGWEWFSNDTSDADMGHWRHIHVTYK